MSNRYFSGTSESDEFETRLVGLVMLISEICNDRGNAELTEAVELVGSHLVSQIGSQAVLDKFSTAVDRVCLNLGDSGSSAHMVLGEGLSLSRDECRPQYDSVQLHDELFKTLESFFSEDLISAGPSQERDNLLDVLLDAESTYRGDVQARREKALQRIQWRDESSGISESQIVSMLQSHWCANCVAVEDMYTVQGAHSREVYIINAILDDGKSHRLVIRRDRPVNVSQASVADEFGVMKLVRDHDLPIPEPLAVSYSNEPLTRPFILIRYIEGNNLRLEEAGSPIILRDIAAILRDLHCIPPERLRCDPSSHNKDSRQAWLQRILQHKETWRNVSRSASASVECAFEWLQRNVALVEMKVCIVHGDAKLDNFRIHKGRVAGLIDFEMAHLGHPAEDLACIKHDLDKLDQWGSFFREYSQSDVGISEGEIIFCSLWMAVRNIVFAANADHIYLRGDSKDFNFGLIGPLYLPGLFTLLQRELELARGWERSVLADQLVGSYSG